MTPERITAQSWQTKPSDRFILQWIKLHLSAPITVRLVHIKWLKPWMITVCSMVMGVSAGLFFALGWGFMAGMTAGLSQILDGIDGQFARLTGTQCRAGAFLDSVLDRYSDGALVIGLAFFNLRMEFPLWLLCILGALALIGSGLISYSSARAESLGIQLGQATLVSKGTRTSVMAMSGILSSVFPIAPFIALCYLVLHTNLVIIGRIARVYREYAQVSHET